MMKKGWLFIIIAVVLIGIVYFSNQASNSQQAIKAEEGFLAPDFILMNEQGEEVTLSSLKGTPVFLNFWASWCPPCRNEMPVIQEAYQEYHQQVYFL